ncbi:MAG: DNA polymerase III subunit alpha [Thermodesulfobacteriota bacterium]
MQHSGFVHLHLHTQYSLLDGAIRPEALLERAREFKMPAVAVTDHGNIFGAVEFFEMAQKAGIKPIIGAETYIAPVSMYDKTPPARSGAPTKAFHLILLVKNAAGYKNLCKILTKGYTDGFYYKPRVDKDFLREHNEGLIALGACLQGEVAFYALRDQTEKALASAAEYKEIFGDRRFFLEIQPSGIPEQVKVNKALIEIGRKLDIPMVATNDCHYLKKEDAKTHDILLCIQTGTTVNAEKRMRFPADEYYMKSPEEMAAAFTHCPEAITNTIEIAERCNFELTLGKSYLPDFPLPPGQSLDTVIDEQARLGLEKRFEVMGRKGIDVESLRLRYLERLTRELGVIKGMGFPGYFLVVSDFINYAKSRNIPVGPGRGSAAGSLVAFALGITNVDPIEYNLLFERFLNPDRISLPDIDIDFCYEKRDEIIKYVTEKYGVDNVTQIITFGKMKARAVIRDVGRVLDMPYGDVDRIAKLIPLRPLDITIEKALKMEPKLKKLVDTDKRVAELIEYSQALEGMPRHASTHAAGVVISKEPLTEYLPLYKGQKDEVVTTQFAMKYAEKVGLVKFDFLGLKTLTVIDKTLTMVRENRGESIDIEAIDLGDEETYKVIASGVTNGIFQLESSGMKDMLKKLAPEYFTDLIAAVALFRPGPLQSGMVADFIKRRHGKVPVRYEIPALKDILSDTYGVIIYQEQVMEIARVLAGFSPGDADVLRKVMGKKLTDEMLIQRRKFLDGAAERKIPAKKAEKLFDHISKFALYGFNKSHSAAYALIAYETAYLKTHYTVEFMAALMSSDAGDTEKVVKYINECRDLDVPVDPPDVNESHKDFTVSKGRIRFGLGAVKNVGASAIEEIISVRDEGPFTSMVDFLSRLSTRKVNKKVTESLIKCGAFDFTEVLRPVLLASLDSMIEMAQGVQRDREIGQGSIFDVLGGGGGGTAPGAPRQGQINLVETEPWTEKELLAAEKETLGFYFTANPLDEYRDILEINTSVSISGLKETSDKSTVTIGGILASLKEITTKKGQRMAFIRVEDYTDGVEVVLFPGVYSDSMELIESDVPMLVKGRLERDEAEAKIIAEELISIEEARKTPEKLRCRDTNITTPAEAINDEVLSSLKGILSENPGGSRVIMHLKYEDSRRVIIALPDAIRINPSAELLEKISSIIPGSNAGLA